MKANKTALITGASAGIGKELAYIHAEHGGHLVLVARRKDKLESIKKDIEEKHSVEVTTIVKDLIQPNATKELYQTIQDLNISIDYLINNAGFGGRGKFHERSLEEDLSMIQLNIVALTSLTKLFLPEFTERNSGRVLNVSSVASLLPGPLQAVYFATKAYVTSFSNALSEELKKTNVTVTALLPGATETEFAKVSGMEKTEAFSNTASARKVSEEGYQAMLEGKLDIISGVCLSQKILLKAIPFAPKKLILSQTYKLQDVNIK